MGILIGPRLCLLLFVAGLLGGCGGSSAIRGNLTYDLRPKEERALVYWPPTADVPRYRYLGELVGEPNFEDGRERSTNVVMSTLQWVAGVFEKKPQVLMQRPQQGVTGNSGRVYVIDSGRNVVFVFDPSAPAEQKSDQGKGQMLMWEFADSRTRFQGLIAVTAAWGDHIAVSDATLGVVVRLDKDGAPAGLIGLGQLKRPTGIAFDPARQLLFVSDTKANDIKVFDATGRLVNTIGSGGERPGEFNAPTHLAFAKGRLYVADTLNSRVQVFDADGRYQRQLGERGLYVGNLARPKGIAVGDDGIVYVIESYYGHLLVYTEKGEFLMGINGSGLKDGGFVLPSGVWTDKLGRVFVADMFNGRVVVFQFLGHDGG